MCAASHGEQIRGEAVRGYLSWLPEMLFEKMAEDPASSVVGVDCKAHVLHNLYVADASFFPSIGAVNPTLTSIANALPVADHIKDRLGA